VAEHLERLDDERIPLITVTGVEIDNDLNRCDVFISTLENDPEADEEILAILSEQRIPLQSAIAHQVKLRKTPEVAIQFDPSVRAGARIDSILAGLDIPRDNPVSSAENQADEDQADGDEAAEVTFD
jgi:ribosome-binding factor A